MLIARRIAFLITIVAALIVIAGTAVVYLGSRQNGTTTSCPPVGVCGSTFSLTTTTLGPSSSNSSTSNASTSVTTDCHVSGAPGGTDVRVLSDSGSPIAGVDVTGRTVRAYCGDFAVSSVTNSTGWVELSSALGAYNLSIRYSGHVYNIGAPMYPLSLTVLTIEVPSGVVGH